MKKIIMTSVAILCAIVSFSQQKPSNTKEVTQSVKKAQEDYDSIAEAIGYNKAAKVKLEKQLELNRVALRKAKLNALKAKKSNEPKGKPFVLEQDVLFEEMSQGRQNGFSVHIPNGEVDGLNNLFTKNVDSEFRSYMKNYSVSKIKKSKGELFFDNIVIPEVNAMPLDLYVDVEEKDNGVTLKSYFYDGTKFIDFSKKNKQVLNAKNILVYFSEAIYKKNLEAQQDNQFKSLEKIEKEKEAAIKEIADAREDIARAEAKIKSAQEVVLSSEGKIDAIKESISYTKDKISLVGAE